MKLQTAHLTDGAPYGYINTVWHWPQFTWAMLLAAQWTKTGVRSQINNTNDILIQNVRVHIKLQLWWSHKHPKHIVENAIILLVCLYIFHDWIALYSCIQENRFFHPHYQAGWENAKLFLSGKCSRGGPSLSVLLNKKKQEQNCAKGPQRSSRSQPEVGCRANLGSYTRKGDRVLFLTESMSLQYKFFTEWAFPRSRGQATSGLPNLLTDHLCVVQHARNISWFMYAYGR